MLNKSIVTWLKKHAPSHEITNNAEGRPIIYVKAPDRELDALYKKATRYFKSRGGTVKYVASYTAIGVYL